jgi:hypothetical protein
MLVGDDSYSLGTGLGNLYPYNPEPARHTPTYPETEPLVSLLFFLSIKIMTRAREKSPRICPVVHIQFVYLSTSGQKKMASILCPNRRFFLGRGRLIGRTLIYIL